MIYPEVNSETIQALIEVEQNESMNADDDELIVERRRRIDEFSRTDPVLQYVVRAFHAIVINIGVQIAVSSSLLTLVDTLTNIYKNIELQSLILRMIAERSTDMGSPIFIEFFTSNLQDVEYPN